MAKQETLEFKGKVTELLPNAMFRVKLENNQLPDNNYEMKLIFSGDSVIRVVAEVIEVALDDQGEPWNTKNKPKHKVL